MKRSTAGGSTPPVDAVRPTTAGVIPGIRGSVLHRTCVEIYRRHAADASGLCPICQRPAPCPSRTFAAGVIETAGDSTRRYQQDAVRLPAGPDEPVEEPAAHVLPGGVVGYALGRGSRARARERGWDR